MQDCYDWQVTVCFYTAMHLVNAHLSKHNLQYRKHKDVNHALNPDVALSVSKLPETEYDSYIVLQSLSRRSRYLVNEKDNQLASTVAAFTYDKHLGKGVKHLNLLIQYFCNLYNITSISPVKIKCAELKPADKLSYFEVVT